MKVPLAYEGKDWNQGTRLLTTPPSLINFWAIGEKPHHSE